MREERSGRVVPDAESPSHLVFLVEQKEEGDAIAREWWEEQEGSELVQSDLETSGGLSFAASLVVVGEREEEEEEVMRLRSDVRVCIQPAPNVRRNSRAPSHVIPRTFPEDESFLNIY